MSTRTPIRNRILGLEYHRAADLAPHPNNWRRHPPRQLAILRRMLEDLGHADALLARRTKGGHLVLIDGHLRRSLDPEALLPVLVLDLDEAESDRLLATLDPIAALAEPDPEALSRLLERLGPQVGPVAGLLEELARSVGIAPGLRGDPEEAPLLPERARARRGDLWVLGEHRLACGDARSASDLTRLMGGSPADVLWTDPPYGVSYQGKTPRRLRINNDGAGGLGALLSEAFSAADAVLRPGAPLYVAHPAGPLSVTFGARFLAQGWRLHQTLVWAKDAMVLGRSDYHYQHEPILYGHKPGPGRWGRGAQGWYGGNDQTTLLAVPRPKASRDHPTAKPVELIRRCLQNSSQEGEIVLDPFLGSGSTLIAAEVLGRRCFALEIDPAYVDVANRRWEELTGRRARRETIPR